MSTRFDFSLQRLFTPYPRELLPVGFQYPKGYLEHSRAMLYPVQFRWWFIDASEEFGDFSWKMRSERPIDWSAYGKDIDPIPFARDGELSAYFDGKDHSGNPVVYVVHLPDNICIARYENFEAWLAAARKESGIGEPPYDKIKADPSYPVAADVSGEYYFCPNCYEASKPLHSYDTAILCDSCGTIFNLR